MGSSSTHKKHHKRKREKADSSSSDERPKKSSKHHKSKKSSKDKKHSSKEIEAPQAPAGRSAVTVELSEDDYFTRVNEFSVWLVQYKQQRFEDLSSEESHKLFEKFARDWNKGSLAAVYYSGRIPEETVAAAKHTKHKWGFISKLSDKDKDALASTAHSIKSNSAAAAAELAQQQQQSISSAASVQATSSSRPVVAARKETASEYDDRKEAEKQSRAGLKEKHKAMLDDVAPKETGRAAAIDKRRTVGASLHGAARERESQMDGLDMSERDTMGGGDDFSRQVSRVRDARSKRDDAKTERLLAAQQKEADTRAAFMAQMGLTAGQKVTIKPRQDS